MLSSYITKPLPSPRPQARFYFVKFRNLVNQLEDVVLDGEASNLASGALSNANLEVLDKVYQVLVLVNLESDMSVIFLSHSSLPFFFFALKCSTLSFPVTRIRRSFEASWASRVESWWPLILKGRLYTAVRWSSFNIHIMRIMRTVNFPRIASAPSNFRDSKVRTDSGLCV